ncbi:MAG: hypothetical protein ACTSPB_04795 [Candidatus Thorarchaeota archaeon]
MKCKLCNGELDRGACYKCGIAFPMHPNYVNVDQQGFDDGYSGTQVDLNTKPTNYVRGYNEGIEKKIFEQRNKTDAN